MKTLSILTAIFLGLFSNTLFAGNFQNGNFVYQGLTAWKTPGVGSLDAGIAYGYVIGVSDALDGAIICLPSNVNQGQITDIVYNYLKDNPQIRQKDGSYLVALALKQFFPCKK